MALHCPDSLAPLARFLNGLSPAKLDNLGDIYSPAVDFHDPLHQTRGLSALRAAYEQWFEQFEKLSVSVTDAHGDDRTGFLLWTMDYQLRGQPRTIAGTTHVKFAADGRVAVQRDHWDASFTVYDEFPVVGWLLRMLKRRIAKTG